jgi:uncharacterized SAM-binding protein YcdF (DUF218 family)
MLTDTLSDREKYIAVLSVGPMLRSDAIVVLCGEDGELRADVGLELLRTRAAQLIVLTGGLDDATKQGAETIRHYLIEKGASPDRLIVETAATNTREQAVYLAGLIQVKQWKRVILVASPYHTPRAFLTVLKALIETRQSEDVQVIPVPASQAPWFSSPDGLTATRLELLAVEAEKVERYRHHVAGYDVALDYLKRWEKPA